MTEATERPTDDYDLILHCDQFSSLLLKEPDKEGEEERDPVGWKVSWPSLDNLPPCGNDKPLRGTALAIQRRLEVPDSKSFDDISDNCLKTIFVAFLGTYNKGKTFVLNHIGKTNLPEGLAVHTKGISMKTPREERVNRFTLVDIAGFDAPVELTNEPDKELALRRGIDRFIQDTVLRLCSVFIVVLGDITRTDQHYLEEISQTLHGFKESFARKPSSSGEVDPIKQSKFPDVIVVHNFALESNLQRCKEAFICQVKNNYKEASWVERRYLSVPEVAGKKAGMRHLFLGRSSNGSLGETDEHNATMYKMICQWITGISNATAVSPLEEIIECCNVVFPRFVTLSPPLLPLTLIDVSSEKKKAFLVGFEDRVCGNVTLSDKRLTDNTEKNEKMIVKTEADFLARATAPNSPPYDVVITKDALFIHLDVSLKHVKNAHYKPSTTKCEIEGTIPRSKLYGENYKMLHKQRFTGPFNFTIDVGITTLGSQAFEKPYMNKDEDGRGTVIILKIQKADDIEVREIDTRDEPQ
eukprot:m.18098 g.18098  ORF g.18098 m.18098 type:complete len:526 (+) comp27595_c0_seq3:395-1972(+)